MIGKYLHKISFPITGKKILVYVFTLCFFCFNSSIYAQKKPAKIWASARFNKKTVMVGEPLVVTITVYTSTWFTEPPVFSEIQIPGSLMIRLENRVGAKTVTIGRKQYPAIEQVFVVYPTAVGKNILPPFTVTTHCPPEGDFKGIERIITTTERSFEVLAPPEGIDTSKWLSAYNVTLSDTWDRPLSNLKAGDVLERRVAIRATGAVAALIPPLDLIEIDFGSTYPKTPILGNLQNASSFTGSRTEIITYLIEKPGEHTFPQINMEWFNLKEKKIASKQIKPIAIEVADNPDLEFILSRQKALQEELAKEEEPEIIEKKPFEFMGMNWWQLVLVILGIISVLNLLVRGIKKLKVHLEVKKKQQLTSEKRYFELFQEACKTKETKSIIRQLFFWYDRFRGKNYNPEFKDFVKKSENYNFFEQVNTFEKEVYKNDNLNTLVIFCKAITEARKHSKERKKSAEKESWKDLNPK